MTTRVTVEANHGWPVKVQFINPKTGNTVGPERIVPPAAKEEFYIHSTMDLAIHEVQPGEGAEADDFQQRVVEEHAELSEKGKKLEAFVLGPVFDTLSKEEKDRLRRQLSYMDAYCTVLKERIDAFGADLDPEAA